MKIVDVAELRYVVIKSQFSSTCSIYDEPYRLRFYHGLYDLPFHLLRPSRAGINFTYAYCRFKEGYRGYYSNLRPAGYCHPGRNHE